MSSFSAISIQQPQLYKIISDISAVTNDICCEAGLFTILNILQFQIYILSIPKCKLSDDLLKYLMGFLVMMNSDIEDVKNTYSVINVYEVHNLLPTDRFISLIDCVDLRVNRINVLEARNNELKKQYNSVLELMENMKLRHKEEISEIIKKGDKLVNDLQTNNKLINNSIENLQQQLDENKSRYRNKYQQLNNLFRCLQQENSILSNENSDLQKYIVDLTKENNIMKIVVIILSTFIVSGLLFKIIKYSLSVKKSKVINKKQKNNKSRKEKR